MSLILSYVRDYECFGHACSFEAFAVPTQYLQILLTKDHS